jgi:hypothetical protein
MKSRIILGVALAALLATSVRAQVSATDQAATVAKAIGPSLVRVEYTLQYDKGQIPRGIAWVEKCPNCGQVHGSNLEDFVREERPMQTAGFLLAPNLVVTEDIQMNSRFIKEINVRFGNQVVSAKFRSVAKENNAVLLALDQPLTTAKQMVFDRDAKPPYFTVTYIFENGSWQMGVKSFGGLLASPESEPAFVAGPPAGAVVDANGKAVGFCFDGELPVDSSWKGSPLDWQALSAAELQTLLSKLDSTSANALMRVQLSFRSPKSTPLNRYTMEQDPEESKTERNVVGVLVGETKILVLAHLKAKTTARLQRILVYPPEGEPVPATFLCTLKDYGALVATVEKPLKGALEVSGDNIIQSRHKLLASSDVDLQGEKRVAYQQHYRLSSFRVGYRQQLYPEVPGDILGVFVFDPANKLLVLPITRREKTLTGREQERLIVQLTPAVYFKPILADPLKYADPSNVPLSDNEENRLAWLGVELQSMNKELARANNVSEQTQDGETGAMVTYVYPNSPAAKAGIETGYILLRLRLAERPNPVEVKLDDDRMYQESFPWDRLDGVPDRLFDRIPTPWPPVENNFTRLLTDAGFGTSYSVEFFADGKIVTKDLGVAASPPHYDSAARYKAEALGITVRDLTYEVRRYFQRKEDEPGIIVSKVEPGSKASVAGIRPYEVITHVNNEPVASVKDFEKLVANQDELNLSVKRMTKGRLVKVRMGGGGENPKVSLNKLDQ